MEKLENTTPAGSQLSAQELQQDESAIINREATPPIGADKIDDPRQDDFKIRDLSKDVDQKDGFIVTHIMEGYFNIAGSDYYFIQRSENYGVFFIPERPCRVIAVSEWHDAVATNGGACTIDILKASDGSFSGTSILATPFDLKATARTIQRRIGKTLSSTSGILDLKRGDYLMVYPPSGVPTGNMSHISITVHLVYSDNGDYKSIEV